MTQVGGGSWDSDAAEGDEHRMRIRTCWLLLAAAVPGLLFAPVFGLGPLLLPIAVVLVACGAAVELCLRVKALRPWRPLIATVLGLLVLCTAVFGAPTVGNLRATVAGVAESWQLTLQSTWPVRSDAELLLFVPLLVLLTAMIGIELLRWPAVALLPGLAALILSQAFVAVSGFVAVLATLGYATVAAGLLMRSRPGFVLVPTVVVGVVGAVAMSAVDLGKPYSLQQDNSAQVPLPRTVSPLTEVAARLAKPDDPVFRYTSTGPVDRWRLVVLTGFDGVTWAPPTEFRRLGARIVPPAGAPATRFSARLAVPAEQWLPSQPMPASLSGAAPLIDPASGTLLAPGLRGPVEYDLSWWEPEADLDRLPDAGVSSAEVAGSLGEIPPGIAQLARTATHDMRPSFRAALVLERYLSSNYRVATGTDLPTGSGWPQLREFLMDTKRGTSEQFAASYVALARIVGIPARLAVGYRAPRTPAGTETVVRNGDVLAWPEVSVAGIGWVPLDPTGGASGAGPAPSRLAQITAKARAELPPPDQQLPDPPLPAADIDAQQGGDARLWDVVLLVLLGLAVLVVLAVLAIPVVKSVRTLRRRRRTGVSGVLAAWWEVRDLLRAYGTRVTPGMTARDLAGDSGDPSIGDCLTGLAAQLDIALWSGAGADDGAVADAWAAVRRIRRTLGGRPWRVRFRAVFAIR